MTQIVTQRAGRSPTAQSSRRIWLAGMLLVAALLGIVELALTWGTASLTQRQRL
ncbi:MAG: hypothetical protein F6K04_24410 [Leptolyngbya sp. SIO4C5]|nr:hypothetical protein [Leptolyngbya sp. SIO4C5]